VIPAGNRGTTSLPPVMLLAIDVGNTQTVIGLYDLEPDDEHNVGRRLADTHLLDHWRVATNAERTADEQALVIQEFLGFHGFSFDDDIAGIVVCSSVPRVTGALRRMSERYFGRAAIVIEPGIRTGIPILYDNPKEVGADRIADAVAAFDLFGGPIVVVDFGTATTFEAISAKGEYLGGAIFPGIDISLDALFARAAALRRVELVEPRHVIGRSTVESMQSGVIYGYTALVDGMVNRIEAELGEKARVVSTGGLSGLITPLSETITHHEPWLTLHGLRLIYEKNQ
jgi:type III pantothenate kinase